MTGKRFVDYFDKDHNYIIQDLQNEDEYQVGFVNCDEDVFLELINQLNDKNEQLRNRLKYWHQRTFKAYEYFDILEKVIDEVCDDDISNQIWKEYEKREKLIE